MSESRIRIRKGSVEIEIAGSEKFVLEQFDKLKELIPEKNDQTDTIDQTHTINSELPESIATFLTEKDLQTFNDKSLVIAYWLEKKGIFPYNAEDIDDGYSQARLTKPGNIIDTMNKNQQKGFVIAAEEKDGKKAWRISVEGEKYVNEL